VVCVGGQACSAGGVYVVFVCGCAWCVRESLAEQLLHTIRVELTFENF